MSKVKYLKLYIFLMYQKLSIEELSIALKVLSCVFNKELPKIESSLIFVAKNVKPKDK